ncbi:hypothetical protein HK104_001104, partial [Borealophlyctis nickersoniae]
MPKLRPPMPTFFILPRAFRLCTTCRHISTRAVTGSKTFGELGVDERLVKRLNELGITHATEIQERALPVVREGKSAIVTGGTGSGKTY